jgi:hypothetical protein
VSPDAVIIYGQNSDHGSYGAVMADLGNLTDVNIHLTTFTRSIWTSEMATSPCVRLILKARIGKEVTMRTTCRSRVMMKRVVREMTTTKMARMMRGRVEMKPSNP